MAKPEKELNQFCEELIKLKSEIRNKRQYKKAIKNDYVYTKRSGEKITLDCSGLKTAFDEFKAACGRYWGKVEAAISSVKGGKNRATEYVDLIIEALNNDNLYGVKVEKQTEAKFEENAKKKIIEELNNISHNHPELLTKLCNLARKSDLQISYKDNSLMLYIDTMAFPLRHGDSVKTKNQLIGLNYLLSCEAGTRIMLAWSVGNRKHNRHNVLIKALDSLKTITKEKAPLTIHADARQLQCNFNSIEPLFKKWLDENKLKTIQDNTTYGIGFCTHEAGLRKVEVIGINKHVKHGPDKKKDIEQFKEIASAIISEIQSDKKLTDVRALLYQRTGLLRELASLSIDKVKRQEKLDELGSNEKTLVLALDKGLAEDKEITRHYGKLLLYSMFVLESTIIDNLKLPQTNDKEKDPEAKSEMDKQNYLQDLIPDVQTENILNNGFYANLFQAVTNGDNIEYIGDQEHEFKKLSKKGRIIYIYPAEIRPILTENAAKKVFTLIGEPGLGRSKSFKVAEIYQYLDIASWNIEHADVDTAQDRHEEYEEQPLPQSRPPRNDEEIQAMLDNLDLDFEDEL